MNSNEQLLRDIELFLRRTGMTAHAFGKATTNEGKLLTRLRDGKGVTLRSADKIRMFMRENKGVKARPRPSSRPQQAA